MQATAEVIDRVIHIVVTAQQPAATQIQRRQAVELSDQVSPSDIQHFAASIANSAKDINEVLLDRRSV